MDLEYEKLIAAFLLLILTLIFALSPLFLIKKLNDISSASYSRNISYLSCFGGGVFLATCLLHLFPDVQEQMKNVFIEMNLKTNYPVAEFLLTFGFLIVLVAEQVALNFQQNEEKLPFLHHHSHSQQNDGHHHARDNYGTMNLNVDKENSVVSSHQDCQSEDDERKLPLLNQNQHLTESTIHPENYNPIHYNVHQENPVEVSIHQDYRSHSILRSFVLVFALSLHSIFEGLAIGLQFSVENVIRILLAVLIHKSIIAFTLGLNLAQSQLRKSNVIRCILFFALTSPIGMVMGSLIVDFAKGLNMLVTSGILQGLASGTFLYVTFFEVLPHELNSNKDRMAKVAFLVIGFSVVSVLILYVPT